MNIATRPKIVVLGMMTKMPVAGVVWQTIHYLVGFERLGYEVYYVEAHARTPSMLMQREEDDGSARAAQFIANVMRRFGLENRWAFHALHDNESVYGMTHSQLHALYDSAELIINLHGGTVPREEHYATGRLVYLETDPVQLQIELHDGLTESSEFLAPHCAYFTFGENYNRPDCRLPVSDRFHFRPTRQPVFCDYWSPSGAASAECFTTIGNWQQPWRQVVFRGEVYHWSKHFEFLKFLSLPRRTNQPFELALASYEPADRHLLESQGWQVRDALSISTELDPYRDYIRQSRGEFTVAKDQNVRLRSGWFSDRSATYLAAGRPVITQDTGFGRVLPTGRGLFSFKTLDEALTAIEAINSDYARHCGEAQAIAREFFNYDVVLGQLLEDVGLPRHWNSTASRQRPCLDDSLRLTPISRFPTTLHPSTVQKAMDVPLPWPGDRAGQTTKRPAASVVVVTYNNRVFNRLCLTSLLEDVDDDLELIVVDNGSSDGTLDELNVLSRRFARVHVIANDQNRGFAAATNQGLAVATGDVIVLLNNDTIVAPGWYGALSRHLADEHVGLVGAVTNRAGNEAEIETDYQTLGEMRAFARRLAIERSGECFDLRTPTMFCVALRRNVLESVGKLDEQFAIGLFEDDDYAMRVRQAGFRTVCATDAFIHHFGQASIGNLAVHGEYGNLFHGNRRRWEAKWGQLWQPYQRQINPRYVQLCDRIRVVVHQSLPAEAIVAVVSKGDDELLDLHGRSGWHVPRDEHGGFAGYHPSDDDHAIREVESVRLLGAEYLLLPATSLWWLDYYAGLKRHLRTSYRAVVDDVETCVIYELKRPATGELSCRSNYRRA